MLATSYEDGKIKKGQRVRSITRTSPFSFIKKERGLECFSYLFFVFSHKRKVIGMLHFTFTAFPFFSPGYHFGMALTNRKDSLPSESEYESFANLISVNTPVSFTTNLTIIVPYLSNIRAISGYLRLDAINLFNALLPPGKEGFWSTSSPLNILLLSLSFCSSLITFFFLLSLF